MAFTPLQKGAATTVALSALALFVAVASPFGGPFGPNGGGGSGSSGGAATAFVSTQTDGGPGFCFNGSCAVSFASDGGVVTLNGAELYIPNGFTDSQKVNPDTIITPYSVVPQAASGQAAFRVAQTGARIYFDVSGNIYAYSDGSQVVAASAWDIPSLSTDTIGTHTAARNKVEIFYPQPYPLGSLASCSSGFKGRLETLSSDGRTYACDGTTTQRVAYSLTGTATLDYGSLGPGTHEIKTLTVSGGTSSDLVACSPINVDGGVDFGDLDTHASMDPSVAGQVNVLVHNDSAGTINPLPFDVKCGVIR